MQRLEFSNAEVIKLAKLLSNQSDESLFLVLVSRLPDRKLMEKCFKLYWNDRK